VRVPDRKSTLPLGKVDHLELPRWITPTKRVCVPCVQSLLGRLPSNQGVAPKWVKLARGAGDIGRECGAYRPLG